MEAVTQNHFLVFVGLAFNKPALEMPVKVTLRRILQFTLAVIELLFAHKVAGCGFREFKKY